MGANKFCSRDCAFEFKRRNKAAVLLERIAKASIRKLQRKYRKLKKRIHEEFERQKKAGALRPCVECGKLFRKGRDKICSAECRAEARRRRKRHSRRSKVASAHKDRCAIRGLPYDPKVTADFVHLRDGGVCRLCGSLTQRGNKSLAPTIGHIVPLNNPLNKTHGHTANNTYTNCASCNGRQANAVVIDGHQNFADPREEYLRRFAFGGYPFEITSKQTEDRMATLREYLPGFEK